MAAPPMAVEPGPARDRLETLLRPIADVRAGEAPGVLLLALNIFLVLAAYYLLKTVRESLILAQAGAAVKTYSSAGQALLLLVLVPTFSAFASRVNRVRLITGVTLFFVANLLGFYLVGLTGARIGVVFFLWVGIFNVMVISQFWAFVNDLYTPEAGRRLFPIVGLGSNVGAWLGALAAAELITHTGPLPLMVISAAVLAGCTLLTRYINRRQVSVAPPARAAEAEKPLGRDGAFELIRKDRYLMLIAALIVLLNVVNTTGEFLLGRMVTQEAEQKFGTKQAAPEMQVDREKFIGEFYGTFFAYANLASFLLQMFAVSRIMKYMGVAGALFIHPMVGIVGYLSILGWPTLGVLSPLKVADNSIDYSLGNTARQALWLPTSREAKYKAKQAVDSFFMRSGDVLAAVIVFVGQRLAFTIPAFAALNVALAGLWAVVVLLIRPVNRARVDLYREGQ